MSELENGPIGPRPTSEPDRDELAAGHDYRVRLSAFQGPLDLLLHLVRRAEVDIHDIPIAKITDQYLDFLHGVDHVDIDSASEFLVMAALLVKIKAATLAPKRARGGEDGDGEDSGSAQDIVDPRQELVQALIAYQRHRRAAETLDRHRLEFWQRHPVRLAAAPRESAVEPVEEESEPTTIELEDAHLGDLIAAYARIAAAVDFTRLGEHRVEYDDTPIELHAADLVDRLQRSDSKRISLWGVFSGRSRIEMIGLFLATLELARQRKVRIEQEDAFGEVELVLEEQEPELDPEFDPESGGEVDRSTEQSAASERDPQSADD